MRSEQIRATVATEIEAGGFNVCGCRIGIVDGDRQGIWGRVGVNERVRARWGAGGRETRREWFPTTVADPRPPGRRWDDSGNGSGSPWRAG